MKGGKEALQLWRGVGCGGRNPDRQRDKCMVTLEGTREALVQSNGQGAGVAGLSIVSKWEVAGGEVGGKGRRRSGPPGTQWRLPDVTLSVVRANRNLLPAPPC